MGTRCLGVLLLGLCCLSLTHRTYAYVCPANSVPPAGIQAGAITAADCTAVAGYYYTYAPSTGPERVCAGRMPNGHNTNWYARQYETRDACFARCNSNELACGGVIHGVQNDPPDIVAGCYLVTNPSPGQSWAQHCNYRSAIMNVWVLETHTGTATACPTGSTSTAGATSAADCTALAGYYSEISGGDSEFFCQIDGYSSSVGQIWTYQNTAGTSFALSSNTPENCLAFCEAWLDGSYTGPVLDYQIKGNNVCQWVMTRPSDVHCYWMVGPDYISSGDTDRAGDTWTCNSDYTGSPTSTYSTYLVGAEATATIHVCPTGSTSTAGATSEADCTAVAGYYLSSVTTSGTSYQEVCVGYPGAGGGGNFENIQLSSLTGANAVTTIEEALHYCFNVGAGPSYGTPCSGLSLCAGIMLQLNLQSCWFVGHTGYFNPNSYSSPADWPCYADTRWKTYAAMTFTETIEGFEQCPSGTTSLPGATSAQDCVAPCSAGSYGPGGSSCSSCPAGSTSAAGATSISGCYCLGGYRGSGGSCTACQYSSNEYQPSSGQSSCLTCPANQSPTGNAATACQCDAGYTGSGCSACTAGKYKASTGPGGCTECPVNTESGSASDDVNDCECMTGTTAAGNGQACSECVTGTYKDFTGAGACVGCGSGSTTLSPRSDAQGDCVPDAGHTLDSGSGGVSYVFLCDNTGLRYVNLNFDASLAEDYTFTQAGLSLTQCKDECDSFSSSSGASCLGIRYIVSDTGQFPDACIIQHNVDASSSQQLTDLSCSSSSQSTIQTWTAPGMVFQQYARVVTPAPTVECSPGTYKTAPGVSACTPCFAHATSPSASTSLGACACVAPAYVDDPDAQPECDCAAGYYYQSNACVPCEANNFCEGGPTASAGQTSCASVLPDSVSEPGSSAEADCQCGVGFETENAGNSI